MAIETREIRACPSCGSPDHSAAGVANLRRCDSCKLVYAPEEGVAEAVYVDGYVRGETQFGMDISHPTFQAFLADTANTRMAMIEQVVGRPPKSILDVGCGSGEVLRAAADRGWTTKGVEPIPESARLAAERGLDVTCGLLQETDIPERSFDVVTAFHVLEHMTHGTEFLRMVSRWVAPGGWLVIEVPNWRSFNRAGNGPTWPHLRPLEHLAHYEPKTLAATLARAGLTDVRTRTATHLWRGQTLPEALHDLGRPKWARWLRRLSAEADRDGESVLLPKAPAWAIMQATRRIYDLAKVGQVAIGFGRVGSATG